MTTIEPEQPDETAQDPDEQNETLPPKPPIEDMPPEDGDDPPDEETDVPEDEYLDPIVARDDATVDDEEQDE